MNTITDPNSALPAGKIPGKLISEIGKDMNPADFETLRRLLNNWIDEEKDEQVHDAKQSKENAGYVDRAKNASERCSGCKHFSLEDKTCSLIAGDIALGGWCRLWEINPSMANDTGSDSARGLAFDRESVRSKRKDGQLVVECAHITKATVNPYVGSEIPGFRKLGLDPEKIYNLLRDPEELKKAVTTLNGVQLLRKHVPVNAEDHRPYDTVGSLGTDAEFVEVDGENYLDNSLFINAQDAIDDVESGRKKQLSAGYHYRPDMTPGNFKGKSYDGVMRDIVFNHVALVEDGRAGPDVVVGDSAEKIRMKPTRLAAYALQTTAAAVAPLLAMDKKIELPGKLFSELTSKNFSEHKPKIIEAVKLAMDGKLKKGLKLDTGMKGVIIALDALEDLHKGYDESVSEPQHKAMEAAAHGTSTLGIPPEVGKEFAEADKGKTFDAEPIKAFLKMKGMADDDIAKVCDMLPKPALDQIKGENELETLKEEKVGSKAQGPDATGPAPAKEPEAKDMLTKPAMDAAIKEAVKTARAAEQGIRVAIATVKPWVGDLPSTMAFDSAADVYRHVLTMKGVDGAKTMHADALLPVLKSLPLPGAKKVEIKSDGSIAQDSSAFGKAKKYAPGLENIQQA